MICTCGFTNHLHLSGPGFLYFLNFFQGYIQLLLQFVDPENKSQLSVAIRQQQQQQPHQQQKQQ